jgi:TolB protein
MLKSSLTSGFKPWVFNVPPTVTRFRFRVAISANILPIVVFDMLGVDGNRDIYRINLDGSQLVRLTSNVSVEASPTVAKDRVVFVSYRDGNANLFSVGLGAGPQTRLTNTGWDETEPSLSSDGVRLAYISNQSGWPRVMHALADGTNPQSLAAYGFAGSIPSSPAWIVGVDPRVAYASSANGEVDILKVRISGGATTRALTTPTRPNIEPSFNTDGTKMTYVRPNSGNFDVYIHDLASNVNTRLTTWVLGDIQPTFTHDGRIVWLSEANDGSYTIRWMSPDGVNKFNVGFFAGDPSNPFGVPLQ